MNPIHELVQKFINEIYAQIFKLQNDVILVKKITLLLQGAGI